MKYLKESSKYIYEDFKNIKSEYEIGALTYKEMVNYILENNLKSVGGDIDYNEARDCFKIKCLGIKNDKFK